jgi:hypothetical protein
MKQENNETKRDADSLGHVDATTTGDACAYLYTIAVSGCCPMPKSSRRVANAASTTARPWNAKPKDVVASAPMNASEVQYARNAKLAPLSVGSVLSKMPVCEVEAGHCAEDVSEGASFRRSAQPAASKHQSPPCWNSTHTLLAFETDRYMPLGVPSLHTCEAPRGWERGGRAGGAQEGVE